MGLAKTIILTATFGAVAIGSGVVEFKAAQAKDSIRDSYPAEVANCASLLGYNAQENIPQILKTCTPPVAELVKERAEALSPLNTRGEIADVATALALVLTVNKARDLKRELDKRKEKKIGLANANGQNPVFGAKSQI
jgi:hypothetical protein